MYFRRNPSWDDLWQAAKNQYLLTHSSIDKALWVQIQAQIDPLCQDPQCLFKGRFQKGIPYRPSRTQTVEVEFTQSLGRIQDFCDYCQKFLCEGCEHQPSPPEASSKCAGCGIEFTEDNPCWSSHASYCNGKYLEGFCPQCHVDIQPRVLDPDEFDYPEDEPESPSF